jgi:quercetin dioxygenase-like cupin family protein
MTHFKDYHECTGSRLERLFKTTLFESQNLLLGLNCLEPGQTQSIHAHDDQDKFYYVLQGQGEFTVGDETKIIGSGWVAWAPAGDAHGVTNNGEDRLIILVGIAPAPAS